MEVHLLYTQEISGAQLPFRRCERRMFVIYSAARDGPPVVLLLPLLQSSIFSLLKVITGRNFEARTLRFFLHLEAY